MMNVFWWRCLKWKGIELSRTGRMQGERMGVGIYFQEQAAFTPRWERASV